MTRENCTIKYISHVILKDDYWNNDNKFDDN